LLLVLLQMNTLLLPFLMKCFNTLINIKKMERGKIKKRERFHSLFNYICEG